MLKFFCWRVASMLTRLHRGQYLRPEALDIATCTGSTYRCRVAVGPQDLLLAQSVRRMGFAPYLAPSLIRSGYEQSAWDLHPNMVHLLVETSGICVGTARLMIGELNPEGLALGYGVPMEDDYDLSALHPIAHRIAEVGRICVLESHRGSGAALALYAGMARVSLEQGVQRWVGCGNSETKTPEQLARLTKLLDRMGLWSDVRFELFGAAPELPDPDSVEPLDRLPPIFRSYVRWGDLRFCGAAVFDDRFSRFALPFVVDPERVLELVQGGGA